jgi:hypothetical protein
LNKEDSKIDDVIFEFKEKQPAIKFMSCEFFPVNVLGWFDDTKVSK